jgi:hypothetical protein
LDNYIDNNLPNLVKEVQFEEPQFRIDNLYNERYDIVPEPALNINKYSDKDRDKYNNHD